MECDTLADFKEHYIVLHKQELALNDERSYFDVKLSNVDGTIFGEMFDNAIRIKFLNENNPQFLSLVNEEELKEEAKKQYEEDSKQLLKEKK